MRCVFICVRHLTGHPPARPPEARFKAHILPGVGAFAAAGAVLAGVDERSAHSTQVCDLRTEKDSAVAIWGFTDFGASIKKVPEGNRPNYAMLLISASALHRAFRGSIHIGDGLENRRACRLRYCVSFLRGPRGPKSVQETAETA
jgi:hypothetical protein